MSEEVPCALVFWKFVLKTSFEIQLNWSVSLVGSLKVHLLKHRACMTLKETSSVLLVEKLLIVLGHSLVQKCSVWHGAFNHNWLEQKNLVYEDSACTDLKPT